MKKFWFTASALAVAFALSTIVPAKAVVVNAGDVGFSGTTGIQGQIGGVNVAGLTGTLGLTYTGLTNSGLTWNFDYTVKNTSSGAITGSRISSFGLSTTPDIVSGVSTGVYGFVQQPPNGVPGFIVPTIDFCAGSSANTCTGGNGATIGQSLSGTLALTFASALSLITLDTAYMRFQSIVGSQLGNSGAGVNSDVVINPVDVTPTPLPPAALMFFTGLAGLGFLAKRRRKQMAGN